MSENPRNIDSGGRIKFYTAPIRIRVKMMRQGREKFEAKIITVKLAFGLAHCITFIYIEIRSLRKRAGGRAKLFDS